MKIRIKPNTKDILEAVKVNNNYCPCKLTKNEDTKCICKEFREQKHAGECECGLYIKEELN